MLLCNLVARCKCNDAAMIVSLHMYYTLLLHSGTEINIITGSPSHGFIPSAPPARVTKAPRPNHVGRLKNTPQYYEKSNTSTHHSHGAMTVSPIFVNVVIRDFFFKKKVVLRVWSVHELTWVPPVSLRAVSSQPISVVDKHRAVSHAIPALDTARPVLTTNRAEVIYVSIKISRI